MRRRACRCGEATLPLVLRLIRAGADPTVQHFAACQWLGTDEEDLSMRRSKRAKTQDHRTEP